MSNSNSNSISSGGGRVLGSSWGLKDVGLLVFLTGTICSLIELLSPQQQSTITVSGTTPIVAPGDGGDAAVEINHEENLAVRHKQARDIWLGLIAVPAGKKMGKMRLRKYLAEVFSEGTLRSNPSQCYSTHGDYLLSSMYLDGCRGRFEYEGAVKEGILIYGICAASGCEVCRRRMIRQRDQVFDNSVPLRSHLLSLDSPHPFHKLPSNLIDIVVGYATVCSIGEAEECLRESMPSTISRALSFNLRMRAASLGLVDAQLRLAQDLHLYRDYRGAMQWFKIAIEQVNHSIVHRAYNDDAKFTRHLDSAHYFIAQLYRSIPRPAAKDIERDLAKSSYHYNQMSDSGHKFHALGILYRDCVRDPLMAMNFFSRGAQPPFDHPLCFPALQELRQQYPSQ